MITLWLKEMERRIQEHVEKEQEYLKNKAEEYQTALKSSRL